MSQYSDGEYVKLYDEEERKARKPHRCAACRETIPPKAKYWVISWLWEGRFDGLKRCGRCQKMHAHLLKKCRDNGYSDEYPDHELNCGHDYTERWGVEPPPEIAALAFALPGDEL